MAEELQIIRASEFVCLDADKHRSFETSKKSLQNLALACRKRGLDRALLDLRGLPILPKPHFTKPQVAALAGAFREAGFALKQRLAVLYDHDVYGIIRDFILFSRQYGVQAEAFLDYEKAMSWLYGKLEDTAEWKRGAQVPIAKPEAKKSSGKATGAKDSRMPGRKTKLPRAPRLTSKRR